MHLIDFKGQEYSGSITQNLLWRDSNVYLMDNHRAALWCWQQEVNLYEKQHNILHIDRHTGCLGANLEAHLKCMPDLRELSIQDYLEATVQLPLGSSPLFRWDNYLSIHLASFNDHLRTLLSVDHGDGDKPNFEPTRFPKADELGQNLLYWLHQSEAPWIVNIDLDYFFAAGPNFIGHPDGEWIPMFSDDYLDRIFEQVRIGLVERRVKVVTVCLTPSNFTPGWTECIEMSERIFALLGAEHPSI